MFFERIFIAAGFVVALAGCDTTGSVGRVSTTQTGSSALLVSAHMPEGQQVVAPLGFISFCMRSPDECKGGTDTPADVKLTADKWTEITDVNDYVNKDIPQVEDEQLYHKAEYWAYPTEQSGGDCEDLALEKRKLLMARGWPASSLLMAVVREWNGDGHAVLIVTTDKGDYVLDNKNWEVVRWQDAPYVWVKRQSRERPFIWVNLDQKSFRTNVADKMPPLGQEPSFLRFAKADAPAQATGQATASVSASEIEASLRPALLDRQAAAAKPTTVASR